jgi:hypothetical protein
MSAGRWTCAAAAVALALAAYLAYRGDGDWQVAVVGPGSAVPAPACWGRGLPHVFLAVESVSVEMTQGFSSYAVRDGGSYRIGLRYLDRDGAWREAGSGDARVTAWTGCMAER